MSDNIATHFFQLTERELELANVFIKDGWHGDMYELVECVQKLTQVFQGE
jgi:hypothetical protein